MNFERLTLHDFDQYEFDGVKNFIKAALNDYLQKIPVETREHYLSQAFPEHKAYLWIGVECGVPAIFVSESRPPKDSGIYYNKISRFIRPIHMDGYLEDGRRIGGYVLTLDDSFLFETLIRIAYCLIKERNSSYV